MGVTTYLQRPTVDFPYGVGLGAWVEMGEEGQMRDWRGVGREGNVLLVA